MNLEQMQQKMKELLAEAEAIGKRAKEEKSEDTDVARAKVLTAEIGQLGKDIDKLRGDENSMSQLAQLAAFMTRPAATVPGVTDDQQSKHVAIAPGSFRAFMETEAFKNIAAHGSGETPKFKLSPDLHFYARANPEQFARDFPEEARALVYTSATANLILPNRVPGIFRGDPVERRVRDAFIQGRTDGNTIQFVSELAATNNAAGFSEATGITAGAPTPAGSAFPESGITFVVASETVRSVGHMIPVTREMLLDVALMETYIRERMVEMLDDKIDAQLLNGAGGNDLLGLNNVSGISVLDAAYFANPANVLASDGEPGENADRLRRARTYLRLTPRARATDIIINPFDLEGIEMARDMQGNYLFGGGNNANGEFTTRLGGMRVIESEQQAAKIASVVARTAFGVFDRMDTVVEVTDSNRNWFEHRVLALAVWARLAFVPFRPAAAAKVTLL